MKETKPGESNRVSDLKGQPGCLQNVRKRQCVRDMTGDLKGAWRDYDP